MFPSEKAVIFISFAIATFLFGLVIYNSIIKPQNDQINRLNNEVNRLNKVKTFLYGLLENQEKKCDKYKEKYETMQFENARLNDIHRGLRNRLFYMVKKCNNVTIKHYKIEQKFRFT